MIISIPYFILAALGSYIGIEWLRRQLIQKAILDIPNQRSSHTIPTPKGGGALIAVATLLGLSIFQLRNSPLAFVESGLWVFLLAGFAIAMIGAWDDLNPLPASLRLGLQMVCALTIILFADFWTVIFLPGIGQIELGLWGALLTLVWIVGLTNAYNFMDGIDGIAGLQGLLAGFSWFILGLYYQQPLLIVWGALLSGSLIGFLAHNWHPAKIFMGDVGSTFLGFSFAVMPLYLTPTTDDSPIIPMSIGLLLATLLVWPFIFDAGLTFMRRLLKGENVLEAHRTHLYQRLTRLGFAHDHVALVYGGIALLSYPLIRLLVDEAEGSQPFLFWASSLLLGLGLFTFVTSQETLRGVRTEWFSIIRNRHLFMLDLLLISISTYISFLLRLELLTLGAYQYTYIIFNIALVLLLPLIFIRIKVYSRYWPYASVSDLLQLILGLLLGVISAVLITDFYLSLTRYATIPRSVPLIFLFVTSACLITPRLLLRILGQARPTGHITLEQMKRVIIVGASHDGINLLREIQLNPKTNLTVVGLVDDAPEKQNVWILGTQILGRLDDIPDIIFQFQLDEIYVAMPTATGPDMRHILALCEKGNVPAKVIPDIYERLNGLTSVNQLRDVKIEDLLRRPPISNETDMAAIERLLHQKRVLITGAGGSIGSELCRQILASRPYQLILLGHGENSIFDIYHQLREMCETLELNHETEIIPIIADTRFEARIDSIFQRYRPQIVYHAAAHKHVPLMEHNPCEAVTNNIEGTRNLIDASIKFDVERFVMISTDKAVNPTNMMGASKRTAELLVHQAARKTGHPFVAVRFGNVLGSRGSVVHTFTRQIKAGGPVTVTHPDITRYFMTIPEAVQLVLQAAVLGSGGEVFVLDMGEPIKIVDLARDLITLSGLKVDEDIDIVYTGLRPGEKLYEELFITKENYRRTSHAKIFVANNAGQLVPKQLNQQVDRLVQAANLGKANRLYKYLMQLIPEFSPKREILADTGEFPIAGD